MTVAGHLSVQGVAAGYLGGVAVGLHGRHEEEDVAALVLAGLDLELPAGDCLAIVGRSGCGKSTLLNVLAGVLPPAAGGVLLDGVRVAAVGGRAGDTTAGCTGHAAYMFQQDLLLPWKTVLGNVTFAARMAARAEGRRGARSSRGLSRALDERARALLEEFGLAEVQDALPAELSGGMRQRVALARTMLLDRGLILLDEPFGSLDAVTREEMRRWLLDVMAAHPATWVLVTHDVEEAVLLGDHVAVLLGRPARLEGWGDAALTRDERRRLLSDDGASAAQTPEAGSRTPAASLAAAVAVVRRVLSSGADARPSMAPVGAWGGS